MVSNNGNTVFRQSAKSYERPRPEKYYGLARYLAREQHMKLREDVRGLIQLDDLFQQGVIGLLEAIQKFDPKKGVKFSTFATIYIRGRIIDFIRRWYHIPQEKWRKIQWLLKNEEKLSQILKREPTSVELADYLDISEGEIEKIRSWQIEVVSVDEIMATQERETKGFELVAPQPQVDPLLDLMRLVEEIEQCIRCELSDIEKFVFRMRILDGETPEKICKALGVLEIRICVKEIYGITAFSKGKIKKCLGRKGWTKEDIMELLS